MNYENYSRLPEKMPPGMYFIAKEKSLKTKEAYGFQFLDKAVAQLFNDYFVWLDKQKYIHEETMQRFIGNLKHDIRTVMGGSQLKESFIQLAIARRIGYNGFPTACKHKQSRESVFALIKADIEAEKMAIFRPQGINDQRSFFYVRHTEYVLAVLDRLRANIGVCFWMEESDLFQLFGAILPTIKSLNIFTSNGLPAEPVKKLILSMTVWYFRSCLPPRLVVRQCKNIPKRFRAEIAQYRAKVI